MVYAIEINQNNFAPAKFGDFGSILNIIIPILMSGIAVLFLVMLLVGAFKWITAGDNPENIKKSQATIMHAILGLIIVIISYVAVRLVALVLQLGPVPF